MSGRFDGKTALVTGGASGIGLSAVHRFLDEGASCVIADIDRTRGETIAQGLGERVLYCATDVTVEDDIAAAVDLAVSQFGRLDCMFNNAGVVGAVGSVVEISKTSWERTLAIQLTGVFLGMKHAARVMAPQRAGAIVSTASIAGLRGGLGAHAYSAAKAGIIGLTMSVAAELAPVGIRVNAVAPGTVVTPLIEGLGTTLAGQAFSTREVTTMAAKSSPLGRAGLPEDVAAAVAFLCSGDAANITGQVLAVDGGALAAPSPAPLVTTPASEIGFR